jgi:hypothetical protein
MEGEVNKFSVISEIYAQFTEKNKENLIKVAQNLLKQQRQDASLIADASTPQKESEKGVIHGK